MRSDDYPEGKIMDSLLAEITKLQSENKELKEAASKVCKIPSDVMIETDGPKVKVPLDDWNALYNVIIKILKP